MRKNARLAAAWSRGLPAGAEEGCIESKCELYFGKGPVLDCRREGPRAEELTPRPLGPSKPGDANAGAAHLVPAIDVDEERRQRFEDRGVAQGAGVDGADGEGADEVGDGGF